MKRNVLKIALFVFLLNPTYGQKNKLEVQPSKNLLKPAFEVNLFSAFLGISDLRILIPSSKENVQNNGSLILGFYVDNAWGKVSRPVDKYGKVRFIGTKIGWNQDFGKHLFGEVTLNLGYRHEEKNIYDGSTLNSFSSRAFFVGGGKFNVTETIYCKLGAGVGIHVLRIGDKYADTEKKLIPAINLTIGFKL